VTGNVKKATFTIYSEPDRNRKLLFIFYWGTSLAEVCELLKFDSLSYFSTLFKSIVGISPGAFRKACLALNAEDRSRINVSTHLFVSRPVPIDDLLISMQQLGQIVTDNLSRSSALQIDKPKSTIG